MKKFRTLSFFLLTAAFSLALSAAEMVPLLSPAQKTYLAMPRNQRSAFFDNEAKRGEIAGNWHPQQALLAVPEQGAFVLTETANSAEKSKNLTCDKLAVTVPAYVLAEKKDGKLALGNLKIATAYRWECAGKSGEFTTEDVAPRLLKIDNVPNVRDLGGRMTNSGVRVKQGRVYRTAGLNSNAAALTPSDEIKGKDPAIVHQLNALFALKRKFREERSKKKKDTAHYLTFGMDKKWVVFRPGRKLTEADLIQLESLKKIPATLFGAKPETVSADKKGRFCFSGPKPGCTAIFLREFVSKEEGMMQIGLGAACYFRIYFNGEQLFSMMTRGDQDKRLSRSSCILNLPVRQGDNLLVIPVKSGDNAWGLMLDPVPKTRPRADVAYKLGEKLNREIRYMAVENGCFSPGKNRFTPEGLRYFTEDLGIRTDLDLRSDMECAGMTGSPAGPMVRWIHISSLSYKSLNTKKGKEAFTEDFKIFLNEKNYPIAFHCIAGQDRTGSLAFILNGLLGVPEEELFRDWESTIFWNRSASFGWSRIDSLAKMLETYPGKNMNEKVESYVLACGFTKADIAKFRKLMLEER